MAILVVDDDQAVRDALRRALTMQGYDVELAADGEEALLKIRSHPHATDLVIVDILMPRLDGLELTRRLRGDGNLIPILMLTARDQVADRVAGLEAGADDYLVKPFAIGELVARLRALLRRAAAQSSASAAALRPPVRLGLLLIDVDGAAASWDGHDLNLTGRELALLDALVRNVEVVLSRDRLLEMVWGYDFAPDSRALDVFMTYLRRKLEAAGAPRLVETVRGVGFVLRQP